MSNMKNNDVKVYDNLETLLFLLDSHEIKSVNNTIIDKIRSVLSDDETDALDEMLNMVRYPNDKVENVTDDSIITPDIVRDICVKEIWDNSEDWKNEMWQIPVGMMSYMNYIELKTFKSLMEKMIDTDGDK